MHPLPQYTSHSCKGPVCTIHNGHRNLQKFPVSYGHEPLSRAAWNHIPFLLQAAMLSAVSHPWSVHDYGPDCTGQLLLPSVPDSDRTHRFHQGLSADRPCSRVSALLPSDPYSAQMHRCIRARSKAAHTEDDEPSVSIQKSCLCQSLTKNSADDICQQYG